MRSRRGCLCRASVCRGPIEKGELRAFSPALANPQYFHPRCVEGGLGPYEQVQGTATLTPAQEDETRDCCDRPGRPSREQYLEDVRRAKRARADPEQQRQAAAMGVPLLHPDDGAPGRPPEEEEETDRQQPRNLAWWDEVSYDDMKDFVATVTDVPREVAAALAQLRGQVAAAILQALERGDALAQQRAEKLFTFFDRTLLFKPSKTRGGRKAGNSGGLTSILTRRIRMAEAGDWAGLSREALTAVGGAPRRARRPPAPASDAKAVEKLVGEHLISKAMVRTSSPATLATGAGVQAGLQQLFPRAGAPADPGAAPDLPDQATVDDWPKARGGRGQGRTGADSSTGARSSPTAQRSTPWPKSRCSSCTGA